MDKEEEGTHMNTSRTAALVLSGGAALGAAHIGAADELIKRGFTFDYYAGVSAGSIITAMLACGSKPDECIQILKKTKLFRTIFDLKRSALGFTSGDRVHRLFQELFSEKRIEDLHHPLIIGTTDFQNGERVMVRTGYVADAVRASISVPVVFEPYYHPELQRWLVDGGLSQNLPLDIAQDEYKGDRIFSVDVVGTIDSTYDPLKAKKGGKVKNLRDLTIRTVRIFFKNQQNAIPFDSRTVRIQPDLSSYSAVDAFKLELFIQKGREAIVLQY